MACEKRWFILFLCGVSCLYLLVQDVGAGDVIEVRLQQSYADVDTLYLPGYEGNYFYMTGVSFESVISYDSVDIGSFTGEMVLTDGQVLDFMSDFYEFGFEGVLTISGTGSCTVSGCGMMMLTSSIGDMALSLSGQLDNCNASLTGIAGTLSGTGEASIIHDSGRLEYLLWIPVP